MKSSLPKRSKGFGLVEMLVTVSIMSVVMIGMFQVFQEGMQLFRTNTKAADAQKAAIKVLSLISAELINATPDVSQHYEASGTEPPGIVFATSLDDFGTAYFDDNTGEIYWQRYISYYFLQDPSGQFNGEVFRAVMPVANETASPPPTGDRNVTNAVSNFISTSPTSFFATDTIPKRRLVANGVSGFDITLYDGTEGGNTLGTTTRSYEIEVATGNPASLQIKNGYYIKVKSRVTPRG